jgi:hypothetical protein
MLSVLILALVPVAGISQDLPKDVCRIVDGKLIFQLDPNWTAAQRNQLVKQFNLDSTLVAEVMKGLPEVVVNGVKWNAARIAGGLIELSKAASRLAEIGNVPLPILMINDKWTGLWTGPEQNGPLYGINRFTKPGLFSYLDSTVTLFLPGYAYAKSVLISGSFNDWSISQDSLVKTEKGWSIRLKLGPGYFPYKFIIDGRWTQDPNNLNKEDDLNGGINSVFYVNNFVFRLKGYTDARKVNLAGSFNGFSPNEIEMSKTDEGWILPIFLQTGTHSYKFIVDGRWMTDPDNPVIRGDGRGNQNSFMSIGDSMMFRVDAFRNAQQVELAGSFNNWQWGELIMEKTAAGWQLPYVLSPGNHEYKYIVDGKWTPDPGNPFLTGGGNETNSVLVINPTHTFVLDGFPDAKKIIVAGSFNGWRENGYRMIRKDGQWILPLWLRPGKYTYRLIVDGKWMADPGNPLYEPNEYGETNSVVWVEEGRR